MQRSFKLLLACALLAGVTLRADNDGVLNLTEAPACFLTANEIGRAHV